MDFETLMSAIESIKKEIETKGNGLLRQVRAIEANPDKVFDTQMYQSPDGTLWIEAKTVRNPESRKLVVTRYDRLRKHSFGEWMLSLVCNGYADSVSQLPEGSVQASDQHVHAWAWREPKSGEFPGDELSLCPINLELLTLRMDYGQWEELTSTMTSLSSRISDILSKSDEGSWPLNLTTWFRTTFQLDDEATQSKLAAFIQVRKKHIALLAA